MSEDAIVGKLRTALQEEIVSECQVVYILVEIRKLLDLHNQNTAFNVLNFHCSWAMHIYLDRDAAQNLIVELNQAYSGLNTGAHAEHSFKKLWDHLGFDRFRKQLRAFLRKQQLPAALCDDPQWEVFLHYYSCVIQDCPLVCSGEGKAGDLRFDKLVLAASITRNTPGSAEHIQISWQAYFREDLVTDFVIRPQRALIVRTILPKR